MKKIFKLMMALAIATFTFTACEDVPEPYNNPYDGRESVDPEHNPDASGTGTLEDPYNAVAAISLGNSLAPGETTDWVYIKGIVSTIREEFTSGYGNGTFYISDDGTTANQFYAYRVLYLGNKRFTDNDTQIKEGDEVIVCGKITNYNGTIETSQNNAFLYSLNGENRGGEPSGSKPAGNPEGDGTQASPYNVAGVLTYIATLGSDVNSPEPVYIKGKISRIGEEYGTQYGNGTFYISDDGEAANEFYVFRALYLGNKKFASGDTQIKVGDEVIVCGNVVNYRGNTPETVQNASYLYSLNGETGGHEPGPAGDPTGTGTLEDPFNSVAAIQYAQSLGTDVESPQDVYIKGKVASISDQYGTQYGNATFTISDDGSASGAFTVYRALYLGNKKYTSGDLLKEGDEVIVCGRVVNFKGNTPETVTGKAWLYSLNGKTDGGSEPAPTGEPSGSGTLDDPYNAVAANNLASELASGAESAEVYIKGKVVSIKDQFGTQYGNATFYISDDGSENGQFYVFRTLYLGNQKYEKGKLLKKGDDVVIYGKLTNYMGNTPETVQNASYLYSLNGSTEVEEDDTPGGGGGGGEVSGNAITVTFSALGFDNAADLTTIKLEDGTTLTFDQGSGNNAPKYYNSGSAARMYVSNTLTINAGSKKMTQVVVNAYADSSTSYTAEGNVSAKADGKTVNSKLDGTTYTFDGFSSSQLVISNDATGTGGSKQLRIVTLQIIYAE